MKNKDSELDEFIKVQEEVLGTAQQAITFCLGLEDCYHSILFLEAWQVGDISEWSEYQKFLKERRGNNNE